MREAIKGRYRSLCSRFTACRGDRISGSMASLYSAYYLAQMAVLSVEKCRFFRADPSASELRLSNSGVAPVGSGEDHSLMTLGKKIAH